MLLSPLPHWTRTAFSRLAAILPNACALCGAFNHDTLCAGCHAQFFNRRHCRCPRCAVPLPQPEAVATDMLCGDCLKNLPSFDRTIVAADYVPPIDQLVLALKFGSRLALAPLFSRMLRDALLQAQDNALPDILIAVPLGSSRLSERGFNQALEIAKPLSRALGIPLYSRFLWRTRDTRAQAMLPPDERHQNMRNAFSISADAVDHVRGKHIGVVDDVITTGETLNEIAATLKRFKARQVTNLVFARTLQK